MSKVGEVETKQPMNISALPPEMFHNIYKFLQDDDTDNCLEVNLQWRNNSNSNLYWEARCKKYGVEDEGDKTELADGKFEDMCRPARIWFAFRNSPAYRWRTNSPKVHRLDYNYYYQKIYKDVKLLSNRKYYVEKLVKFSQPNTIYKLYPALEINGYLFMGEKFAVFHYKMILLIFKFEGNNLIFQFAIGLKNDKPHIIDCFDEERFRNSGQIRYPRELVDYLENRILLQMNTYKKSDKYWIDLRTRTISPITIIGKAVQLTENHMIVAEWILNNKVHIVYDHEGSNPRVMDDIYISFKANDNVFIGINSSDVMVSWDMKTGQQLQSFPNISFYTFLWNSIHPYLEIAYMKEDIGGIKAINLRTGKIVWANDVLNCVTNLTVVCDNYLVEYAITEDRNYFFVFDIRNGSYLYQIKIPYTSPTRYSNISRIVTVCDSFIKLDNMIISFSP